jgi:hypothetical protein
VDVSELRREYAEWTGTDKVLLVNPGDLGPGVQETLVPQRSGTPVHDLYSRTSLAAPILASARHEVLVSTREHSWPRVDMFIEEALGELPCRTSTLTILASPLSIEMSFPWTHPTIPAEPKLLAADLWHYAELDGDPLLDIAVGRIFGISTSDVSTCVARSLFHAAIVPHPENVYTTRGIPMNTAASEVYALGQALGGVGYAATITPAGSTAADWSGQSLVVYKDHGAPDWAGIHVSQLPLLDPAFVMLEACLTCAFTEASDGDGRYDTPLRNLFCANLLRKGAVGCVGATDTSGYCNLTGLLTELLGRGAPLGAAFVNAMNQVRVYDSLIIGETGNAMGYYVLLGDPTLRLATPPRLPLTRTELIEQQPGVRTCTLTVPVARIPIPEEIRDLCETPHQVRPLHFTTAFNRNLSTDSSFVCGVSLPPEFQPVAVPRGWKLCELEGLDGLTCWLGRRDSSGAGLFSGAADLAFTDLEFHVTLHEAAPDLHTTGAEILDQELRFSISNPGNAPLEVPVTIQVGIFGSGCPALPCDVYDLYVTHIYDPSFLFQTTLSLEPDAERDFRLPIPSEVTTAQGTVRYEDYPFFHAHILVSGPADAVQQDYSNDEFHGFLERG